MGEISDTPEVPAPAPKPRVTRIVKGEGTVVPHMLVAQDGTIRNIIALAEGSKYTPRPGLTLVPAPEGAEKGGNWDGVVAVRKVRKKAPSIEAMVEAILAQKAEAPIDAK